MVYFHPAPFQPFTSAPPTPTHKEGEKEAEALEFASLTP